MWKTLATVLAGVVPGIIIGMAIAAFFVSAPMKSQVDLAQKAEKGALERSAALKARLSEATAALESLKKSNKASSEETNINIDEIRQVCREENARAVKSGKAIAEITRVLPKQAQAVKDLAASCPPNTLVRGRQLLDAIGQD